MLRGKGILTTFIRHFVILYCSVSGLDVPFPVSMFRFQTPCSFPVSMFLSNLHVPFPVFMFAIFTVTKVRHHIILTCAVSEETHRCIEHKRPPSYSGRPLVRLRHERVTSYPHWPTTSNDNNLQTAPWCLRAHNMSSSTWHPSHRHSGLHPPASWRRPRGRPPLH